MYSYAILYKTYDKHINNYTTMPIEQKSNNRLFLRIISIIILVCYSINSSGAYAMGGRTLFSKNSHAQRFLKDDLLKDEQALKLTVPAQLGNVLYSYKGKSKGLIVHIQDCHANTTAQLNIADIISTIEENYDIGLLCLEGASNKLNTSHYDQFPKTQAKELTSKFFLQEGLFTGPEYYKILNPGKGIKAYGVEDKGLYKKHVKAYRKHNADEKEIIVCLQALKSNLNALKPYIFSMPLKVIDQKEEAYKNKHLQLEEYVSFIIKEAAKNDMDISAHPSLEAFSQAASLKNGIDFKKAERQRDGLVKELSKILKNEDLNRLLKNSIDLKLEKISASAYYEYIEHIIGLNADLLGRADYRDLFDYIEYIRLSGSVDSLGLFDEIGALLKALRALHYNNETERLFDGYIRYIQLSIDLYKLELTENNLNELMALHGKISIAEVISFINSQNKYYNIEIKISPPSIEKTAYKSALHYYQIALKRDEALISNTLRRMAIQGKDSSILVTGGFHTRGIVNILKKLDVSYIVICPKIGSSNCKEVVYQRQMLNQMPESGAILNFISNMLVGALNTGDLADTEYANTVEERFSEEEEFLRDWIETQRLINGDNWFEKRMLQEGLELSKASSSGLSEQNNSTTVTKYPIDTDKPLKDIIPTKNQGGFSRYKLLLKRKILPAIIGASFLCALPALSLGQFWFISTGIRSVIYMLTPEEAQSNEDCGKNKTIGYDFTTEPWQRDASAPVVPRYTNTKTSSSGITQTKKTYDYIETFSLFNNAYKLTRYKKNRKPLLLSMLLFGVIALIPFDWFGQIAIDRYYQEKEAAVQFDEMKDLDNYSIVAALKEDMLKSDTNANHKKAVGGLRDIALSDSSLSNRAYSALESLLNDANLNSETNGILLYAVSDVIFGRSDPPRFSTIITLESTLARPGLDVESYQAAVNTLADIVLLNGALSNEALLALKSIMNKNGLNPLSYDAAVDALKGISLSKSPLKRNALLVLEEALSNLALSDVSPKTILFAFRDIASLNADLFRRSTILAIESALQKLHMDDEAYSLLMHILERVTIVNIKSITPSIVNTLEAILGMGGADRPTYKPLISALKNIKQERPELITPGSRADMASRLPKQVDEHGFWCKNIYFNKYFQDRTKHETEITRYSIAQIAYRLLLQYNRDMGNIYDIKKATDFILKLRSHPILKTELFSKERRIINVFNNENRFDSDMKELKNIELSSGADPIRISYHKGRHIRGAVLDEISDSKGPLTLVFRGHGNKKVITLGSENIGFNNLGRALINRGDLDNVIFLNLSCFSYDYITNLLEYLKQKQAKAPSQKLPIVFSEADFDQTAYGTLLTKRLKEIYARKNAPLTVGDLMQIEEDENLFDVENPCLIIPVPEDMKIPFRTSRKPVSVRDNQLFPLGKNKSIQQPFLRPAKLMHPPLGTLQISGLRIQEAAIQVKASSAGNGDYEPQEIPEILTDLTSTNSHIAIIPIDWPKTKAGMAPIHEFLNYIEGIETGNYLKRKFLGHIVCNMLGIDFHSQFNPLKSFFEIIVTDITTKSMQRHAAEFIYNLKSVNGEENSIRKIAQIYFMLNKIESDLKDANLYNRLATSLMEFKERLNYIGTIHNKQLLEYGIDINQGKIGEAELSKSSSSGQVKENIQKAIDLYQEKYESMSNYLRITAGENAKKGTIKQKSRKKRAVTDYYDFWEQFSSALGDGHMLIYPLRGIDVIPQMFMKTFVINNGPNDTERGYSLFSELADTDNKKLLIDAGRKNSQAPPLMSREALESYNYIRAFNESHQQKMVLIFKGFFYFLMYHGNSIEKIEDFLDTLFSKYFKDGDKVLILNQDDLIMFKNYLDKRAQSPQRSISSENFEFTKIIENSFRTFESEPQNIYDTNGRPRRVFIFPNAAAVFEKTLTPIDSTLSKAAGGKAHIPSRVGASLRRFIDSVGRIQDNNGEYWISLDNNLDLQDYNGCYSRIEKFYEEVAHLLEMLQVTIPGQKWGQNLYDMINMLLGNAYDSIGSFYDPAITPKEERPIDNYSGKIAISFDIETSNNETCFVVRVTDNGRGEDKRLPTRKQELMYTNNVFYSGGNGEALNIIYKAIKNKGALELDLVDSKKPSDKNKESEVTLSIPLRYLEIKKSSSSGTTPLITETSSGPHKENTRKAINQYQAEYEAMPNLLAMTAGESEKKVTTKQAESIRTEIALFKTFSKILPFDKKVRDVKKATKAIKKYKTKCEKINSLHEKRNGKTGIKDGNLIEDKGLKQRAITDYYNFWKELSSIFGEKYILLYPLRGIDVIPQICMKTLPINDDPNDLERGYSMFTEFAKITDKNLILDAARENNKKAPPISQEALDVSNYIQAFNDPKYPDQRRILILKGFFHFLSLDKDISEIDEFFDELFSKHFKEGDKLLILDKNDLKMFKNYLNRRKKTPFTEVYFRGFKFKSIVEEEFESPNIRPRGIWDIKGNPMRAFFVPNAAALYVLEYTDDAEPFIAQAPPKNGIIEKSSSGGIIKPFSQVSDQSEDAININAIAKQVISPTNTPLDFEHVSEFAATISKMDHSRPSAYIIERGNIFGATAQVIPSELFEAFEILSENGRPKTSLILDISKDELASLLEAYGVSELCDTIKSSEEILGKDIYDATAKDRSARIKALTGIETRLILGLGLKRANIGIVANPITDKTEGEFNALYNVPMLKERGIRVAKIKLSSITDKVISLPQALKALANMIDDNQADYISDYIIEILPVIVTAEEIQNAIVEYKRILELVLESA